MRGMGFETVSPGEERTEPSLQYTECHFTVLILKWHKWKYAHLHVTHLNPRMKFHTCTSADEHWRAWLLYAGGEG